MVLADRTATLHDRLLASSCLRVCAVCKLAHCTGL